MGKDMKRVYVELMDGTLPFAKNVPDEDVEAFVRKIRAEGCSKKYDANGKYPHGSEVFSLPHAIKSITVANMPPVSD
jgi:hypothetical protein